MNPISIVTELRSEHAKGKVGAGDWWKAAYLFSSTFCSILTSYFGVREALEQTADRKQQSPPVRPLAPVFTCAVKTTPAERYLHRRVNFAYFLPLVTPRFFTHFTCPPALDLS